jgi:hypothetical protein
VASDTDICNLALSHLGDSATVVSIDPPEGSAQADHCAAFYPLARDSMLEMHTWGFATRRATLAELSNPSTTWRYCYAVPRDALNLIAVLAHDATDDYSTGAGHPGGLYAPQPYVNESLDDGTAVVLTNQEQAVLRYTQRVTDSTKFSPLFVTALSWHLASMLAGPLLKGDSGRAAAADCTKQMLLWLGKAQVSDANQRRRAPQHNVSWIANR